MYSQQPRHAARVVTQVIIPEMLHFLSTPRLLTMQHVAGKLKFRL